MPLLKQIFIASDHAGYDLKQKLMSLNSELPWVDLGPENTNSVDYPDFADKVALALSTHKDSSEHMGLLICGSGQGMAIRANRHPHIRAALCASVEYAQLARAHNNANVLCLGGRMVTSELAQKILNTFLNTPFEGGRHERRIHKLSQNCSS